MTHDLPADGTDPTSRDESMRMQLRAFRRDEPPPRDLWSGIATRLPPRDLAAAGVQPAGVQPPVGTGFSQRRRWVAPVALAATLVMAMGFTLWHSDPDAPAAPTTMQREAEGMTRQYQAAIGEFDALAPSPHLQPAFDELDRNAVLILDALAQDPDSPLLLQHLRRTYAHRLALSQRLMHG